jgi:uncharacterized protein (TIGR03032 family)
MTKNEKPAFAVHFSRQFESWLDEVQASLACTTYQAGKVFFLGRGSQGVSIAERTFARSMGIAVRKDILYLASLYQLWRFQNVLEPGQDYQGYDRLFVPQLAWTTGDLDVHDIGIDTAGDPIFVNTLFSCIARPCIEYSFRPIWKPPFISRLVTEDRCHLNGLAMHAGEPIYATAVSRSNANEGWRDNRTDGGIVIDVRNDEIVCQGLSMPHSPRWYDDRLWLLNSGTGYFGYVDQDAGCFAPVTFCPGYARGLAFVGHYALVGLSKPRTDSFSGLQLDEELSKRSTAPRCGILVVDLKTGGIAHSMRFEGVLQELYDVAVLPQVRRPMLLGLKSDEIRRVIRMPPDAD